MTLGKKIALTCVSVLLVGGASYGTYYALRYSYYDGYKDFIKDHDSVTTTEFVPLTDTGKEVPDMELAAENDKLKLYADPATGNICVYVKETGEKVYSNPVNAEEDPIANGENMDRLKAQMIVSYFNKDCVEGYYNTYTDCVAVDQKQLTIESIEDGIRFNYTIAPKKNYSEMIPAAISDERYQMFYDKMEKSDQKIFKKNYPLNEETGQHEILAALATANSSSTYYKIYKALYEGAGYTFEDYEKDMEAADKEPVEVISFQISLDYHLEDDSLVADIPSNLIKESVGKISSIELLTNFGAAGTDESGYFVVPNGSGSLINFNNQKIATSDYSAYVYGIDPLSADYTKVENSQNVRFPIIGICRENSSILMEIEEGASLAQIKTRVSGKVNSYNSAYSVFTLRGYEKLSMFGTAGNAADIPVVEPDIYDEDLTVRYCFLGEEEKGYSGLARYYHDKLIADGVLTEKGDKTEVTENDIPFYYDLIGGTKKTAYFLGTQYLTVEPMTTFDEAKSIAEQLKEEGITKQIVNYQGWMNGGYYQDVTDKVKLIGKLGSRSDMESLSAYLEENGGKLYADTALQKVSYISKRFSVFSEAARYYTGYSLTLGQVNPKNLRQTASLGYEETLYSIVSPKFLVRYAEGFNDAMKKYDITGLSFRDLGDVLASDKRRTEMIDREEAKQIVMAELQMFAESDKDIMIRGGNDYSLKNADDVIDVALEQSNYYSVDQEIPFVAMVLHGTVDYAGTSINLGDDYDIDELALTLIENGASPHFTFTAKESNEMKYTGLNMDCSTTFDTWKETSAEVYSKVNDVLKYVESAQITAHEILDNGISRIEYSNGAVIYVNKGSEDASADGITVPAKSCEIGGVNK